MGWDLPMTRSRTSNEAVVCMCVCTYVCAHHTTYYIVGSWSVINGSYTTLHSARPARGNNRVGRPHAESPERSSSMGEFPDRNATSNTGLLRFLMTPVSDTNLSINTNTICHHYSAKRLSADYRPSLRIITYLYPVICGLVLCTSCCNSWLRFGVRPSWVCRVGGGFGYTYQSAKGRE